MRDGYDWTFNSGSIAALVPRGAVPAPGSSVVELEPLPPLSVFTTMNSKPFLSLVQRKVLRTYYRRIVVVLSDPRQIPGYVL